jgi:hypothetical protein
MIDKDAGCVRYFEGGMRLCVSVFNDVWKAILVFRADRFSMIVPLFK